ncbi:hypothetical protein CDAR_408791 [Caerostris darwini]|uniref:Uncharacterized protein n=1 Tax=Caerostris darwini TaxID=1538125 RepID=A0AAV4MHV6_9ARAC|nr:hypothetical protein CDAR_408791 [Caerostris darwini]
MKYFNIDKRHARRLSDRPSGSDTFSLFAVFYCHLASGIPSSEYSPTANSFRNSRKLKFLSPLESFLVVSFCDCLFWNHSLYQDDGFQKVNKTEYSVFYEFLD